VNQLCRALRVCGLMLPVAVMATARANACSGPGACMEVWATADGQALTVQWNFVDKKVQTFPAYPIPCMPSDALCIYSQSDTGFMAPTDDIPGDEYSRLADGTTVSLVIVSNPTGPEVDPGLSMNFGPNMLQHPGDHEVLGTMPTIHNHPSWQIAVPGGELGDYRISFQLKDVSDAPRYADSPVYTAIVTNVPPAPVSPSPTASPAPTPTPRPCAGDCNHDGRVTVDEIVHAVDMSLRDTDPTDCEEADGNGDGKVSVAELISAVRSGLQGCAGAPAVSFAEIQATIFDSTCAVSPCHDAASHNGNLVLAEGVSYGNLVGVQPDTGGARLQGFLRVDPGHPDNSFLLVKLLGPPDGQGTRMPPPPAAALRGDQIKLIRDWILQGAPQ